MSPASRLRLQFRRLYLVTGILLGGLAVLYCYSMNFLFSQNFALVLVLDMVKPVITFGHSNTQLETSPVAHGKYGIKVAIISKADGIISTRIVCLGWRDINAPTYSTSQ